MSASTDKSDKKSDKTFSTKFFTLDVEEARRHEPYDYIIVGTGIGGGVLAADIFKTNSKIGDAAKSILVIEKGGLVFHSHCLNTARPEGLGKDRGQQNDSFFAEFKDNYDIKMEGGRSGKGVPENKWKGGPMYNLGGRSAAWGLFAPRVHDTTLEQTFPPVIFDELKKTWYEKTEKLMNLSMPDTKIIHQHLIEKLNMEATPVPGGVKKLSRQREIRLDMKWHWGRIASEFRDDKNFDFAEGAYSTIDKLLEIMMSKPWNTDGSRAEHKNFKMLINTEVRSLILEGPQKKTATGVVVKTQNGETKEIRIKAGGAVVLCAGSVESPAILLRSGVDLDAMGGGHITDHDILYRSMSFRYLNPAQRSFVGSMKLQTYFSLGDGQMGLANVSLDASSFLPRGEVQDSNLPTLIAAFILPAPLEPLNNITLVNDEPRVNMIRTQSFDARRRAGYEMRMKALTLAVKNTVKDHLKVEFINDDEKSKPYLSYLELGGVAHELGSVPMPNENDEEGCLDTNLMLKGHEGIYVCDLSIFPISPEANPTLTLAALALRLSYKLVCSEWVEATDPDTVYVVNHSGEPVKVWLSNRALDSNDDESEEEPVAAKLVQDKSNGVPVAANYAQDKSNGVPVAANHVEDQSNGAPVAANQVEDKRNGAPVNDNHVLERGGHHSWKRKRGVQESIFVFRVDKRQVQDPLKPPVFKKDEPELVVGYPGKVAVV